MCLYIRKATCCALAHKPYSQHVTKASYTIYGCHPFNPINNHVVNSLKIIVFYLNIIIRRDVYKINTLCTMYIKDALWKAISFFEKSVKIRE